MANSGKELEDFVRGIETVFLPLGFEISSNDKVFDEEGNQIAEFDVVISGRLGTTEINWLIECRDRPSGGAAPVRWIEQLFGRRDRFNFNKVTAVSTTGFSPSAKKYADNKGIELRSVKDIRTDTTFDWINTENFIYDRICTYLRSVHFNIPGLPEELNKSFGEKYKSNEKIFTHTTKNKSYSLLDIWTNTMGQIPNLSQDVESNEEPKAKFFPVKFTNSESRYVINLHGKDYKIEGALFRIDVSLDRKLIPVSKITQYTIDQEQKDTIAESVHFELNDGTKDFDLAIHKVSIQDQLKILITKTEHN